MRIIFLTFTLIFSGLAIAGKNDQSISTEKVVYKDGAVELEGYISHNPKLNRSQSAILIVHDWMGNGEFSKEKAERLAEMGYVGFAVDIYGKGVRPKDAKEASALAGEYKGDRARLRSRIKAAYDYVKTLPHVNSEKIAVIGYCFGGTTALELARAGVPLAGVVSFHGGLDNPNPADAKKIKSPVLVLHGADDPFVPANEVNAFRAEMTDAKVKMNFISYPGAVHSFTNPKAGNDNKKGAAYNAAADKASWQEMKKFFSTVL